MSGYGSGDKRLVTPCCDRLLRQLVTTTSCHKSLSLVEVKTVPCLAVSTQWAHNNDAPLAHGEIKPSITMRYLRFMDKKKSSLLLKAFSLSTKNSVADTSSISLSSFRIIHTRCNSSSLINKSSRRVPERRMFIAG